MALAVLSDVSRDFGHSVLKNNFRCEAVCGKVSGFCRGRLGPGGRGGRVRQAGFRCSFASDRLNDRACRGSQIYEKRYQKRSWMSLVLFVFKLCLVGSSWFSV